MRGCKKKKSGCLVWRILWTVAKVALIAYAALFTVFYFNLDTKLFYRIMPILNKYHYDVMPHKDFAESIRGQNDQV